MDFIFWIVIAALAFPVLAVVALVKTVNLAGTVRRLDARIEDIERHLPRAAASIAPPPLPAQPAPPPPAETPPTPVPPPETSPELALPPRSLPPPIPPTTAAPAPRPVGFEERFGTQWVVWVGGAALALGGIFLVRYSIQQGLIGPAVRVALGGLLALGLVAAGEWSRRTERRFGVSGLPSANIPSILTAAGTTVAYATVCAAYALYSLLPPSPAFILLGVTALLTLAAALLHGPALAGLGLVGAFLAPALVASDNPDYWALYVYIAVVTAAAFALARFRLWLWLAVVAIALSALWTLPGIDSDAALAPHIFSVVAGFALTAALLVCGLLYGPPAVPGEIDRVSSFAPPVYLALAALLVLASHHEAAALTVFFVLTVATVAIAWRADSAAGAVPIAAVLVAVIMPDWAVPAILSNLMGPSGVTAPAIPEPQRYAYGAHLWLGTAWAALFGIAGFLAQGRARRAVVPMLWCAAGVFAPLAILIALYYRIAELDRSLPFAALALLLAALFALAAEALMRREARPGMMAAGAIYATGTTAALALALTFALEHGWLTVGLALMVPGVAWVAAKRPLPWLRRLAAILVAVVIARIGYEPRIAADVGASPIFNWLTYSYGVPAAAFWLGGTLLRRRADDVSARAVDAGAILFTVLLAIVDIRHYIAGDIFNAGGDLGWKTRGFVEAALYVNVGLALAIGLERVRGRTGSIAHDVGALIIAGATSAAIVVDLLLAIFSNFGRDPVGGPFVNLILLGYGLPALLAAALALIARTTRPLAYRVVAAATAVALALAYLTLEVRRLFHGPILFGLVSDAEQYAYSSAWLVFAIALLAIGFLLRSQPARYAALAVMALTIAKVFLFDTANLTGIYRALSAIGLGAVLIGVGFVYQRLLYPRAASGTES